MAKKKSDPVRTFVETLPVIAMAALMLFGGILGYEWVQKFFQRFQGMSALFIITAIFVALGLLRGLYHMAVTRLFNSIERKRRERKRRARRDRENSRSGGAR